MGPAKTHTAVPDTVQNGRPIGRRAHFPRRVGEGENPEESSAVSFSELQLHAVTMSEVFVLMRTTSESATTVPLPPLCTGTPVLLRTRRESALPADGPGTVR
ncbi:hypothetical protein GCM10007147_32440 [Nocardiopsis kunsanensis]|uniref:Uncharacterized protein n=1 Tax=Nocardiopsis kunsanensis TaxID=141693 RepID=A0A918XG65_9ACTN|nr:hypothetical protein GCM10007147_32440 [Nocardiopsis kunsanensis]